MSRDGRGHPGRYVPKNLPKLKLIDVLKRRKTSLRQFLTEFSITTYGGLFDQCQRMGIVAPTQQQFDDVVPPMTHVNSPQEGVVVLEAPRATEFQPVCEDSDELFLANAGGEAFEIEHELTTRSADTTTSKKSRRRKDVLQPN